MKLRNTFIRTEGTLNVILGSETCHIEIFASKIIPASEAIFYPADKMKRPAFVSNGTQKARTKIEMQVITYRISSSLHLTRIAT